MTSAILRVHEADFWQNPYPEINRLRETTRVARTDDGTKVILRHADVEALLNGGGFINEGISLLERRGFRPGEPFHYWRSLALGSRNGDDHRRIRVLVGKAMGARQVQGFEPVLERCVEQTLDALLDTEFDAIVAIGEELPLAVIGEYLGIPREERARVDKLVREGQAQAFGVNVTEEIRVRVNDMFAILLDFIGNLIEERNMTPQNDLLSGLLTVQEGDERLSRDELVTLFLNLFVGATESTANALTTGLWILGREPVWLEALREDPSRVEAFVEEVLRLYPPNLLLANKVAAQAMEFCGEHFDAGERVVVPIAAPNRDPRVFETPDEVRLERPSARHFTFSLGTHFCLGQALARAQIRTFFAQLAWRCRAVELSVQEPEWVPFAAVNRMRTLPLRLRT